MEKGRNKKKFPSLKKELRNFLTSEEGKVSKKDITKITLGVLTLGIGLAGLMRPDKTDAACGHGNWDSHSNGSC